MSNNILTASKEDAERILARKRRERTDEYQTRKKRDLERLKAQREHASTLERRLKILRALLKSGQVDDFFGGFNGNDEKWAQLVIDTPDEWVWVRAKYGVMGIPFPDGSEYCFAPGVPFPLHRKYLEAVKEAMDGEIREVAV